MFEFGKLHGGIMKCVHMSSAAESYLTLCDSIDCSPPGSSVHGISQARILQFSSVQFSHSVVSDSVTVRCISFSRGCFQPRGWNLCLLHWKTDSLPLNHLGNPVLSIIKYLLVISTQSIQPRENIETLSHCSLCEIKDRVKIENRERACTVKMHVNHKLQECDSLCYHSSFLHLLWNCS